MTLTDKVKIFITANNLFKEKHNILLAVSGGVDSMVMLHILFKLNYKVAVAHVNFNLRAKESNRDYLFVKKTCQKYNLEFFQKNIDTKQYALKNKLSIQEAAREIRYNWFYSLCKQYNYNIICTAHNKNDLAETTLINLTRGTGIEGIIGIKTKNNVIARPMLCATRTEIELYASENNLKHITDSSNYNLKYARNRIRINVIPQLLNINPAFIQTNFNNIQLLTAQYYFYKVQIDELKQKYIRANNNEFSIDTSFIYKHDYCKQLLFEFINDFGFNNTDCENIISAVLSNESGKLFNSKKYILLVNREYLIIKEAFYEQQLNILINKKSKQFLAGDIHYSISFKDKIKVTSYSNHYIYINADNLIFPLTLRNWYHGEKFSPFGLKGSKKISDFLVDKKVNLFNKKNTCVLLSNNKIIALLPFCVDNGFKITDKTKKIMLIQIKKAGE